MATAVVAGAIASKAGNGGEAWVRLSWVRGLSQLGFDVYLVEQVPDGLLEPSRERSLEADPKAYFERVMEEFGLAGSSCLFSESGGYAVGMSREQLEEVAAEASVLLNISGNLTHKPLLDRFRRRVYLDIDPGFTQFWHLQGLLGRALEEHSFHFTVGENIGKPECSIPSGGVRWQPTRQPVVLADWPPQPSASCRRLTTVGSLRGPYGRVEHAGRSFGLKVHELRRFAALPSRVDPALELALAIDPADELERRMLAANGWRLVDPGSVASRPDEFRDYVRGSDGEFSVAQGIYVETSSGWFSDRTARYLASSKPAVVQDTGIGAHLPVGDGLLTFSRLAGAAGCIQRVCSDYERHSHAARRIAEEYLEAGQVVGSLIERVGVAP